MRSIGLCADHLWVTARLTDSTPSRFAWRLFSKGDYTAIACDPSASLLISFMCNTLNCYFCCNLTTTEHQ